MALDSTPDVPASEPSHAGDPAADRPPIPRREALLLALVLIGLFVLFGAAGVAANVLLPATGGCGGG